MPNALSCRKTDNGVCAHVYVCVQPLLCDSRTVSDVLCNYESYVPSGRTNRTAAGSSHDEFSGVNVLAFSDVNVLVVVEINVE
tara:strand:+ start:316 stop:564 length:249 start_codon:yes stop_codon:yes gene_type:complete